MKLARFCIVLSIFAFASSVATVDACDEYFEISSSPDATWLGLHPAGQNYGLGQSFTADCTSLLETAAFKFSWGTDYTGVRSLEYGDMIHVSILDLDGVEKARQSWMVDTNLGSRTVTFDFGPDDVLLAPGTYVAALWTDAPGCGGVEYYDADAGPGARYQSLTADDFTTWAAVSGEATHRIVLDASVTPNERADWSSIKASYR